MPGFFKKMFFYVNSQSVHVCMYTFAYVCTSFFNISFFSNFWSWSTAAKFDSKVTSLKDITVQKGLWK